MGAFDGVSVLVDGCYVWLNQMHSEIYGYSIEESLGKSWAMLYDAEESGRIERDIFPELMASKSWSGICRGLHKDGHCFEVELRLRIAKTGELICCCRDISPIVRAELAQRQLASYLGGLSCVLQSAFDTQDLSVFTTRMLRLVADNVSQAEVLAFVPGKKLSRVVPAAVLNPPPFAARTAVAPINLYRFEHFDGLHVPQILKRVTADALHEVQDWARKSLEELRVVHHVEISPIYREDTLLGIVILGHNSNSHAVQYSLIKFLDPVVSALATVLLGAKVKRENNELQERRKRLFRDISIMAKSAQVMFWRWNIGTEKIHVNDEEVMISVWGQKLSMASEFIDRIDIQDRERVVESLLNLRERKQNVFDMQYRVVPSGQRPRVIRTLAFYLPAMDDSDEIQGISYDLTKNYEISAKLRDSEYGLRKLFEWMPDGVLLAIREDPDKPYKVVALNDAMRAILSLRSAEACVGQELGRFLPAAISSKFLSAIESPNASPISLTQEVSLGSSELNSRYIRFSISTGAEEGGSEKLFIRATDIDEQRKRELEQKQISELHEASAIELRRLTRLKDEFLANMSHELRTPLNGILGACEILEEGVLGKLTQKQLEMLDICSTSGKHLLGIINDILDLSKIEAGKMQLEYLPVEAIAIFHDVCRLALPLALQAGVSIEIQPMPQPAGFVQVDCTRFRQVLLNLLMNAIKYSPRGSKVHVACIPLEDCNAVRFDVIDSGAGIEMRTVSGLFLPFEQGSTGLNRTYEGTGLGLTLVQKLVQLHFGHVAVQSALDEGSRFSIVIPSLSGANQILLNSNHEIDETKNGSSVTSVPTAVVIDSFATRAISLVESLRAIGCSSMWCRSIVELPSIMLGQQPSLIFIELGRSLEAFAKIYNTGKDGLPYRADVVGISDYILEYDAITPTDLYRLSTHVKNVIAQPFSPGILAKLVNQSCSRGVETLEYGYEE